MNHLENLAQTYSQAPWRRQLQIIGLFSLVLVLIALVAGIYLSVSAKSAAVGRDIQAMQNDIEDLDRDIEDLQSELATILSSSAMEARALQLGFTPLPAEQTVYLKIPGYAARQPVTLAPNSQRTWSALQFYPLNIPNCFSIGPSIPESLPSLISEAKQ